MVHLLEWLGVSSGLSLDVKDAMGCTVSDLELSACTPLSGESCPVRDTKSTIRRE